MSAYWIGEFNLLLQTPDIMHNQDVQNVLTFNMDRVLKYMDNFFRLEASSAKYLKFKDICDQLEDNSVAFTGDGWMNRDDSFAVLKDLMQFQHETNWKLMFLTMIKWFDHDMEPKKKNTWLITGPPDCAKTWFATAWKGLARFTGKILNYTKGGQFCFGGADKGRLILHDECIQLHLLHQLWT